MYLHGVTTILFTKLGLGKNPQEEGVISFQVTKGPTFCQKNNMFVHLFAYLHIELTMQFGQFIYLKNFA